MTLNEFLHAHFIIHSHGVIGTFTFYAITLKERRIFLIQVIVKLKFRCRFVEILTHIIAFLRSYVFSILDLINL